jgi:hypothetical protein
VRTSEKTPSTSFSGEPEVVGCSASAAREVTVERDPREASAARERQAAMVEELREVELVRDRLEGLNQLVESYPQGHDTRVLLENLHLDRALEAVEEDIRDLVDRLVHPRGT